MSKICFFISDINHAGGTERVTSIIANTLSLRNKDVTILSLSGGDAPFFELNGDIKFYSLFEKKISMKKSGLLTILKLRKFLLEHKIDTLISVDSILCVFSVPALFFLKIKHICWEHFNFKVNLGVKFRNLGRILAARYCDHIVTLTKRDKQLWRQGLKKINAEIIPIPNPSPFENVQHSPSLDYKTVLSVGRLTYQKGFDILIEVWSLVCKKNPDWVLKIVGSGEDEIKLKDQAKFIGIEDKIEFVGQTKDVNHYYRTASFYCMSSRFEGLPMVLLEAQSYGLPIIAFDCDTGPSELIRNHVNGVLVEYLNINEMAEKINQFINSKSEIYLNLVGNSKNNNINYSCLNTILLWENII